MNGAEFTATQRDPLLASVVRIFDLNGIVAGSGFLVAKDFISTCAHVVNKALGRDREAEERPLSSFSVMLDFPGVTTYPYPPYAARVIDGGWYPIRQDESGDVAILRLGEPAPVGARPAPLVILAAPFGTPVRASGYPDGFDNGQYAYAKLQHALANGNIQFTDDLATGPRIVPGYSGAALWERDDQPHPGVVGMVTLAVLDPAIRTAYAAPAASICNIWQAGWPPLSVQRRDASAEPQPQHPDGVLASMPDAQQQQQKKLDRLYRSAVGYMRREEWQQALRQFDKIQRLDATFQDVSTLRTEAERQQTVMKLYAAARELLAAEDWQGVIDFFKSIADVDTPLPDPEGILAAAETQKRLGEMYTQGIVEFESRHWSNALHLFEQVKAEQPDYQDVVKMTARASLRARAQVFNHILDRK